MNDYKKSVPSQRRLSSSPLPSAPPPLSTPSPLSAPSPLSISPSPFHPSPSPSNCQPTTVTANNFLHSIRSFLRSDCFYHGSEDLVLSPVDRKAFAALQHELDNPRILTGKVVDSIRYDYCPETSTLTIPSMPTPVHDAISAFCEYVLRQMCRIGFLSIDEEGCLEFDAGGDIRLPLMRNLSRDGCKGGGGDGTAIKQPDAAFYFIGDKTTKPARYPPVVFEVALSQSYSSVREDAKHWLLRSQGKVKLVIVIKLFEGKHPAAEIDHEEIEKKRLEQLKGCGDGDGQPPPVDEGGTDGSQQTKASQPVDSARSSPSSTQSSTAEDHQQWYEDDPSPWVGPITGFMELHRYDPVSGAIHAGRRYDIFPPASEDPRINITDLLPSTAIQGDPGRSFAIPLEKYRSILDRAVRKLASNRRGHRRHEARKRKIGEDLSGEYVPDEQSTGGAEGAGEEIPRKSKRTRAME